MPFPHALYVPTKSDARHTHHKLQHRKFPLALYPGEGKNWLPSRYKTFSPFTGESLDNTR